MSSDIFRTYILPLFSLTSLICLLLTVGTILIWVSPKKQGRNLVTLGTLLLLLSVLSPLRYFLFSSLENTNNAIPNDYDFVVVLGARTFPDTKSSAVSQLSPSLLARVAEGVRLVHKNPESRLIVTGHGNQSPPEANIMALAATELGIQKERIIVEDKSMNTKDHPHFLKPILKDAPFILVTSGYHMPRAILNFRNYGLNPTPLSTDSMVRSTSPFELQAFIPKGENLGALDRWCVEMYSKLWTVVRLTFMSEEK